MRRFPVWMTMIMLAAVAGCQTNMPAPTQPRGGCSHRQADAGVCEPPSNFRLFDYLVGDR